MAEGDQIDTVVVSFKCDFCKNEKDIKFAVYEDALGGPDLKRLAELTNNITIRCPNCGASGRSGFTIDIKLSNKIANHQGWTL